MYTGMYSNHLRVTSNLFNPSDGVGSVSVSIVNGLHLSGSPGSAGRPPDPQSHAGRQQGVLPKDEGGLLPLPGRGGLRGGEGG